MVDPISRTGSREVEIQESAAHPYSPFYICSCDRCGELIYQHAVQPKFLGYSQVDPATYPELSTHQYFICGSTVAAFAFRLRSWRGSPQVHDMRQMMAVTMGALMR